MQIHVISNGKLPLKEFAFKIAPIESWIDYVHIREKDRTAKEIVEGVQWLLRQGIPLSKVVINDRVDVAVILNTGGIQLAYHSLDLVDVKKTFPKLRVGSSVHSVAEAIGAQEGGADYLVYGHIFETNSKAGIVARGTRKLKEIVEAISIPVIAIGGIKPEHVPSIIKTGSSGIAIMSSISEASDPLTLIKAYRKMEEK